ncbi:uncharacterized protein LOC107262737 isoform X1 [Cephus cinctus]|uniref:XK-related protein n=2 Tax=Cephus cinctus TaxID=211228 RepID=A0AAJ7FC98_CEPCN|nr:uncharacterized protein LOC107262737 isoform X1 [Cephus cinctus]
MVGESVKKKMVNKSSPICQAKAMRCLKVPLKSTEQIYLVFLIPTLVNCCVYVIHFSMDLVTAEQHFKEGNPVWGSCTIALMYSPAIAYFVLTVSRPDWWMTEDDKLTKGIVMWFLLQLCQLIAFPLFALYRYAGLIVLAIDAIVLTGEERTKTLNVASKPAAIELYFFLQAWFQAAPQAIFQTHLLFRVQKVDRAHQSVVIHILCVVVSVVVLAIQTMSFQRFESQRINGRKLPWAMWLKKHRDQELEDLEEKKPLQSSSATPIPKEDAIETEQIAVEIDIVALPEAPQSKEVRKLSDQSLPDLKRQISQTPPLPPRNAHLMPPPTPLRGVTSVTPLPVPEMPAPPRPDSIAWNLDAEEPESANPGFVTRSVSIAESTHRTHSLRLPQRKYSTKGLEEDDPVGRFMAFLWWFLFILSRILSIAVFYEFYPEILGIVIAVHYALMLAYLFYYSKDYEVTTVCINLWLGLVYIFSVIEYKIKFKYPDKWLLGYYTLVMLQNTFLSIVYYFYANWESFWYMYIFFITLGSMGLCILSTTVYFVLFKPKTRRIYSS